MTPAQLKLTKLAETFREELSELQALAAKDPTYDIALFPDLEKQEEGSNAWLAYMEYCHDERGNWPPAAIIRDDGSIYLEFEDATLDVLPPVARLPYTPRVDDGTSEIPIDSDEIPFDFTAFHV